MTFSVIHIKGSNDILQAWNNQGEIAVVSGYLNVNNTYKLITDFFQLGSVFHNNNNSKVRIPEHVNNSITPFDPYSRWRDYLNSDPYLPLLVTAMHDTPHFQIKDYLSFTFR